MSEITSGAKVPKSIINLQKELDKIRSQQDAIDINLKTEKSEFKIKALKMQFAELDKQAEKLGIELDNLVLNPQNTIEAKQLQAQQDLFASRLQTSKDKANALKNELNEVLKKKNELEGGKLSAKIKEVKSKLSNLLPKNNPTQKGLEGLNKKVETFGRRIKGLLVGAFVFNILSSGISQLSQGLMGALKSNKDFSSSLNQIKANLLTAFAPIYEYILPAINSLMSALSRLTGSLATFMSGIFGKTVQQSRDSAKALYNQSKAYNAVGKSAEDANGSTASFDKLEVISDSNSKGSGGSSEDIDFSAPVEQSSKLLDFLNKIKDLISQDDWFGAGKLI